MKYYEKKSFNPGGIKDRYDSRDYQWEEVGGAAIETFNWDQGFDIEKKLSTLLKVKDQGPSFSCGGQSWGYLSEVLECLSTGTYEPRSAKYLYAQTCIPSGGSRGRDNADIFVNQGVAREDVLTSYQNGNPPSEAFMQRSIDITDPIRMNAKLSKASAYAQVGTDMESVATAIAVNSGCVIGVDGSNNGTWLSAFPQSPAVTQWRHWLYAGKAKLVNGKKYIGVINSWGIDVGEGGWQWLSESYFNKNVWSTWTHVFAPTLPQNFNHKFLKDLKYKMTTLDVAALQDALKIEGQFPAGVPSSGYYGMITAAAVLAFQTKYQIIGSPIESESGKVVGPKTRVKLNSLFGN